MTTSAARLTVALLDAIDRLDDPKLPLAETARRVAAEADRLGLTRPSYERMRQLIHLLRELSTTPGGPSRKRILFEHFMTNAITRDMLDQLLLPQDKRRPRR